MGTAALSERDYVHRAIDQTDLIISIGHDTVEKPPFIMRESGQGAMHIGFTSASVEQVIFSHAEVVGDIGASLTLLIDRPEGKVAPNPEFLSLRHEILARINDTITRSRGF
jgi:acetolactate synthase I/II/III large subunit